MHDSIMEHFYRTSIFSGANAEYIEDLYETYLHDANALPDQWRAFFDSLPGVDGAAADVSHETIRNHFELLGRRRARPIPAASTSSTSASRSRFCN